MGSVGALWPWLAGPSHFAWLVLGGPVLLGAVAALGRSTGRGVAAIGLLLLTAMAVSLAVAHHVWRFEYGALALALGALAFWESPRYLALMAGTHPWSPRRDRWYYLLLGAFVASLVGLGEPWPLWEVWLAVEATTLSSVGLIVLNAGKTPFEAAWKYMILATFGGLVALMGIVAAEGHPAPGEAAFAAALLVIGFGTKAGLAPLHYWLPDAHTEAPAPVSALLSGVELAGVLFVLREALVQVAPYLGAGHGAHWPFDLLLGLGLASLAVGVGLIPLQTNLKRLLAYSSIEHMGVVAVGIAFGDLALLGALLHVFTHGLAKSQAFYMAGRVHARYETLDVRTIGRLGREVPWTGAGLLVAVAALAGIPPLGPFWSEWLIVMGGFQHAATTWAAAVTAFLLAIGLLGLGRRLPVLWLGEGGRVTPRGESWSWRVAAVVMSVLTASAGLVVPWVYGWH